LDNQSYLGGFFCSIIQLENYCALASSSSSAPTNSGSTLTSPAGSSSTSSSGGSTDTTAVSASSKNSYLSDTGKSATKILSPISNSVTSITISSGISAGFALICNSNSGCCKIPPSLDPAASPSIRIATATSNASDISTT